jgi:hypothetical protein
MLAVALTIGLLTGVVPMNIAIAGDGAVFSTRMQGWYKTSQKTLAVVLRSGLLQRRQRVQGHFGEFGGRSKGAQGAG